MHKILFGVLAFAGLAFTATGWTTLTQEQFVEAFKGQETFYKNAGSYSLVITHASFTDHNAAAPYEQVSGYLHKDGSSYHSFILGVHTVQNEKVRLEIDSAEKSILVSSPDRSFDPLSSEQLKQSMQGCAMLKERPFDKGKAYRIEYKKGNQLQATEYYAAENGQVTKMVLFYNKLAYNPGFREKTELFQPRIEVGFTEFRTGVKFSYKNEFDENAYVTLLNGKYKGTGAYSTYRVFDTRPPK
jgi:hypothetical protein